MLYLLCNYHKAIIKVGTVEGGAFCVCSSVPSFGCVSEKTYEHQQKIACKNMKKRQGNMKEKYRH